MTLSEASQFSIDEQAELQNLVFNRYEQMSDAISATSAGDGESTSGKLGNLAAAVAAVEKTERRMSVATELEADLDLLRRTSIPFHSFEGASGSGVGSGISASVATQGHYGETGTATFGTEPENLLDTKFKSETKDNEGAHKSESKRTRSSGSSSEQLSLKVLELAIKAFYETHNQEKVSTAGQLAQIFLTRQNMLNTMLTKEYGCGLPILRKGSQIKPKGDYVNEDGDGTLMKSTQRLKQKQLAAGGEERVDDDGGVGSTQELERALIGLHQAQPTENR